jgi:hypothetical protein
MGLVFHFLRRDGSFSTHMKECTGHKISDSALSQRRQALPWRLFELLLEHVLKPRAQKKAHPEAFWKGWRLCALDGTQVSVQNTPQVLSSMSKAISRRFEAAFAKVQMAVVVEIGLHNPLGAAIGTKGESEMELARQVLKYAPEGSLLIADRYYGNGAFLEQFRQADPHKKRAFLVRVKSNLNATVKEVLRDGSALVEIQSGAERIIVREVRARVARKGRPTSDVRLWTSLLDPKRYPARELMETYAKRWEEEIFFKEFKLDVHPRGGTLLQSHTEETAAQELAAIFIAMALLAERRMEAAAVGEVPVLRISLGKTLGYLEALWQILSAGEGIISRPQSIALIQKVIGHIVVGTDLKLAGSDRFESGGRRRGRRMFFSTFHTTVLLPLLPAADGWDGFEAAGRHRWEAVGWLGWRSGTSPDFRPKMFVLQGLVFSSTYQPGHSTLLLFGRLPQGKQGALQPAVALQKSGLRSRPRAGGARAALARQEPRLWPRQKAPKTGACVTRFRPQSSCSFAAGCRASHALTKRFRSWGGPRRGLL